MITTVYTAHPMKSMFMLCTADDFPPSADMEYLLRQQKEIIAELRAQLLQRDTVIAAQQEKIAQLQEQVRQLQKQLDDLNRTN